MRSFSKIVISLPLLAGAWIVGTGSMNAAVQEFGASQAVEILARSESIDARCRYLSASEHQELQDYVAKAEVAAAGSAGAERASDAIRAGSAAGKTAKCNRLSEITVRATMDAARRAVAANMEPASAPVKKKRRAKKIRTSAPTNGTVRMSGSAARYRRLAAAYYVERRCQHLSHAQAVDFWRRIVNLHNRVLTTHGPDALSAAKSQAIAHAKAKRRCNMGTAKLVRTSYRIIKRQ